MKKYILFFTIIHLICIPAEAQFPGWSWAISAGGPEGDGVNKTTTDASGNVFIIGTFTNYITFGSTTLVSNGDYDLYVAKYNSKGNLLWAISAGGEYRDFINDITTDAIGNIYITGSFRSSFISFGSTTITNPIPNVSSNFFIVKYSTAGDVLWAKSAGISEGLNGGNGIITDALGNVFVTGGFGSPSISFDSLSLTNNGSFHDIFIVKYSGSGSVIWAISEGGPESDNPYGITIDVSGNLIVIGSFSSAAISFGSTILTNSGSYSDIFIAKYTSSGEFLWATSAGGNNTDEINGITTDASGNIYVTGRFIGSFISFGSTTFMNAGQWDMFIAKYSSSGDFLWARHIGTSSIENGFGITTDSSGDFYVIGSFDGDSIIFDSIYLANSGQFYFDGYIVKYSTAGDVIWATSIGGEGFETGRDITIDALDNIYVTGTFSSELINFGSIVLNNEDPALNSSEVFLAKIGSMKEINNMDLVAYPNPVQQYLNLKSEQEIGGIHLYDFLGRKLLDIELNEKHYVIDVGQLAVGIYYLKSDHQEKGIKIIKY